MIGSGQAKGQGVGAEQLGRKRWERGQEAEGRGHGKGNNSSQHPVCLWTGIREMYFFPQKFGCVGYWNACWYFLHLEQCSCYFIQSLCTDLCVQCSGVCGVWMFAAAVGKWTTLRRVEQHCRRSPVNNCTSWIDSSSTAIMCPSSWKSTGALPAIKPKVTTVGLIPRCPLENYLNIWWAQVLCTKI